MPAIRSANWRVLATLLLCVYAEAAHAQFTTVFNVPPDTPPSVISPNTQVNVLAGGALGDNVDAGPINGTNSNVEVNINGGTVGEFLDAYHGSTINLSSGAIGLSLEAHDGSHVNVSGGTIGGGFRARNGSEVILTGGQLSQLLAAAGSMVTVNGGTVGSTFSNMGQPIGGFSGPAVLNLISGGLPSSFDVFEHSILNMSGGSIGSSVHTFPGSVVYVSGGNFGSGAQVEGQFNLSGGTVAQNFNALSGSDIEITGGTVRFNFQAYAGSNIEIRGGTIGSSFTADAGSTVRIGGGAFADSLRINSGAATSLIGNDFALDGQPIVGLGAPGTTLGINVPAGAILTGTFADGVPFAFTSSEGDVFDDGTITLEAAALPAIGAPMIIASSDPVPLGIRAGQTLVVDIAGAVREGFAAGPGSTLVVQQGGSVLDYAKAVGAVVNIEGGKIGSLFDAMSGSVVNLHGGELGSSADIYDSSTLNVSGGKVNGQTRVKSGGEMYVTGGQVGSLTAEGGSYVAVNGGLFTSAPRVLAGGALEISGGVMQPGLRSDAGSELTLRGAQFRLDGMPVAGLGTPGDSQQINIPASSVLSGVLVDGTPIVLASHSGAIDLFPIASDQIADDVLTLVASDVPDAGPTNISVPGDTVPLGLRGGQTLTVAAGGNVPDRFMAIEGSTVQVHQGGRIGSLFEAVGARVDVLGGALGNSTAIYEGTVMNIVGGSVTGLFAGNATRVHISKQSVVNVLTVGVGSTVRISGGDINVGGRDRTILVQNGASLSFTDTARTSGVTVEAGGSARLSGGTIINEVDALANSNVALVGSEFLLDGVPIAGLDVGVPLVLLDRGGVLSGRFASGQPFEFTLNATTNTFRNDYVDSQAVLELNLILPGDYNRDGVVDSLDYFFLRSQFGTASAIFGNGADGNYDGVVDSADYIVWRRNIGRTVALEAMQSTVPEPLTFVLAIAAIWACGMLSGRSSVSMYSQVHAYAAARRRHAMRIQQLNAAGALF